MNKTIKKLKSWMDNLNLKQIKIIFLILVFLIVLFFVVLDLSKDQAIIKTSVGDIKIEFYTSKAPQTTANFKQYVKEGFYKNTVFHRVIPGFMIQGGGFNYDGTKKQTNEPIELESNNGLSNEAFTVAMARTQEPNSATSQFFINTVDNSKNLDYTPANPGYAVFAKVIDGQDTVKKIEQTWTTEKYGRQDWPITEITIKEIELI